MDDYTPPVVWYRDERGLWFKQGEVLVGPVLNIYALNRDLGEWLFADACGREERKRFGLPWRKVRE